MGSRIGILTGGGDCPGLNGVIRAATLHARHTFGWEVVGIRNGFEGLYQEEYVDLHVSTVQHKLPRGGPLPGSSNRANPVAHPGGVWGAVHGRVSWPSRLRRSSTGSFAGERCSVGAIAPTRSPTR